MLVLLLCEALLLASASAQVIRSVNGSLSMEIQGGWSIHYLELIGSRRSNAHADGIRLRPAAVHQLRGVLPGLDGRFDCGAHQYHRPDTATGDLSLSPGLCIVVPGLHL